MIEPQAFVDQARQWIGVKYVHQGMTRFGADCVGMFKGALKELGQDVSGLPSNYSRMANGDLLVWLEQNLKQIKRQAGAVALMQFPLQDYESHLGLITPETLIHTDMMIGKIVEVGFRPPWSNRTSSYWALPGVRYQ